MMFTAIAWTGTRPTLRDVLRFLVAYVASLFSGRWQPGEFDELWVVRVEAL